MRHHRFFVSLNPPFRDQRFLLRCISLPILPQISQNNERNIRPKCKKKTKHTAVLNKQKRTIGEFKCWLNCQLASFEALRSLEKNHRQSNAIAERGPFFASCRTKTISVKLRIFLGFFVSHRRNMSGKRVFVVTERCFVGDKKKGCDACSNIATRENRDNTLTCRERCSTISCFEGVVGVNCTFIPLHSNNMKIYCLEQNLPAGHTILAGMITVTVILL